MIHIEECAPDLTTFFISNMPLTTRSPEDSPTGLKHPYTVPSVKGFRNFFYWDTYFANWGLLALGMFSQAKNNLSNMSDLIHKYGYVPNADVLINRSQPPLFTRAVSDYVEASGDRSIIEQTLSSMVAEHSFWITKRSAPCGLARYGSEATKCELEEFNSEIASRLNSRIEDLRGGIHDENLIAAAESGWDFSSRFFDGETCVAASICPVDLNSILYDAEKKIAAFAFETGDKELSEEFTRYAEERKKRMNELMYDPTADIYVDYDFEKKRIRSGGGNASSFAASAFGIGSTEKGLSSLLKKLELPHGLTVCEKNEYSSRFQWDYPFMWAPVTAIVCEGLIEAGLKKDALRIMRKYNATIEVNFRKTGNLWEKYNAATGEFGVSCEYETPPMLGWTAGVYLRFCGLIKTIKSEEEKK